MSQAALNVRNREAQQKRRGGKMNAGQQAGLIFLLVVVATLFAGGFMVVRWMNDASRQPLSRLIVTGKIHYTRHDDVRRAILSLGAPGTFMSQDVDVIQHRIEQMPWIKQVSVRKQWPDELKIHLVEYVPVARWNDSLLVDAAGKSFSVTAGRLSKEVLPMLYGPEGSELEVLTGWQQLKQRLAESKLTLKTASMTARRSWQLVTADDMRIELGRNDILQRLTRFIELYPLLQQQAANEQKRINYVDLRYDAGAAVGWAPAFFKSQDSNQQQNQAQAKQ